MKNNRQIGLNGRIFISNTLRSNSMFVFILMAGGLLTAFADILKLTGRSGAVMGTFTTTLLLYDFIVSLLLVIVVFYAYFLECGDSVPVLREKPLVLFGLFRLGYYILLAYYICYRALYCITHTETVSSSLFVYYMVQFVLVFLLILANCFVYNILTRNMIRRSYIKSFHRLATAGMIVQLILPIAYIVARILMSETGDEYFTTSLCDMLRLCICPLCSISVWMLYISAIGQVKEVFEEVDKALRERRYQITYTAPDNSEEARKSGKKNAVASTAFLPAPPKAEQRAVAGQSEAPKALGAADTRKKDTGVNTSSSVSQKSGAVAAATAMSQNEAIPVTNTPVMTDPVTHEPYVAVPVPVAAMPTDYSEGNVQNPNGVVYTAVPLVQEFDPFPSDSAPLEQTRQQVTVKRQNAPRGNSGRPQQGGQNRSGKPQRSGQQQKNAQGARRTTNSYRGGAQQGGNANNRRGGSRH